MQMALVLSHSSDAKAQSMETAAFLLAILTKLFQARIQTSTVWKEKRKVLQQRSFTQTLLFTYDLSPQNFEGVPLAGSQLCNNK